MKYEYIIVECADMFYEEGLYDAKFDDYIDALNYLEEKEYDELVDKLKWLEQHKTELTPLNKRKTQVIVSYF